MNLTTKKEIYRIESEVKMLKKLKEIQKVLLSSGAYSTVNIERQMAEFDKAKVPNWEREIVENMWGVQIKFSHMLLKQVDVLVKKMEVELENEKL